MEPLRFELAVDGPLPEPRTVEAAAAETRPRFIGGEAADAYVQRLVRAIGAARLNAFFPDARRLTRHLSFLGGAGSHGVYDGLFVARSSGLPTAREVLRVKIDGDLAEDFLRDVAEQRPPSPESPLARRIAYYRELSAAEVMQLNHMSVELRQRRESDGAALFRVRYDRFDLASEMFVRYTILLTQHGAGGVRGVRFEEELARATEGFRRIISRFASDEAELCFVLLSEEPNIVVEDVRRCRIGPLLGAGSKLASDEQSADALAALLDPARSQLPDPWILCFPEDRAGLDVTANSSGDALAPLLRDALSEQSRTLLDRKADELGYRVAKQRKFVCPRGLQKPLAALCRKLGAPSVVRGI
ncbi:MAG: hypothetical protein KC503_20290 [Myxococcales bacterium]|nr:hypothetical protein [Myxococcales bacterium]